MTTVAYRAGIIAADTGVTIAEVRVGTVSKIARNTHGDLCGVAGTASFAFAFRKWFIAGEKKNDEPEPRKTEEHLDRAFIIRRDQPLSVVILEDGGWHEISLQEPHAYFAVGSGKEIAMGAMFRNATAFEAVTACLYHDALTMGEIETLEAINGTRDRGRQRRSERQLVGNTRSGNRLRKRNR